MYRGSIANNEQVSQDLLDRNGKLPTFVALAFRNGTGYRYLNARTNSVSDVCILCENFVKFGPVTPEVTGLICERLQVGMTWPKYWCISSNISGSTAPIFAFVTPYESALHADDGSVA